MFTVNSLNSVVSTRRNNVWNAWFRVQRSSERLRLELAIPRTTAAAENYLLIRATELRRPLLLAPTPPPKPPDAMTQALQKAATSFPRLLKLWRDELGLDLETIDEWEAFSLWRDLRHVLVHRLGDWQPGLDPKPQLRDRIARIGADPDVYRGKIPLVLGDLSTAAAAAIAVVLSADAKIRS